VDELAVLEFCCAAGIPRSVFLGRVVAEGEPLWLPEDRQAALEYQAYQKSLCPGGCGRTRSESFDISMDDRYDVETWVCHACAARDRRGFNRNNERDRPPFGVFYAVVPEAVNGAD
jgi:predicted Fe-S protein YdhL (DUF1289 family)